MKIDGKYFSKSMANCYKACPLQFKYSVIDKLPERPDVDKSAMIKGGRVHNIIDKFYNYFENKCIDTTDRKKMNEVLNEVAGENKYILEFDNFLDFHLEMGGKIPKLREQKMHCHEKEWVGIIDRVDEVAKNEYMVIDYKTGNSHDIEDYRFELSMYKYLFEKNGFGKCTRWGILFLTSGELISENVDMEEYLLQLDSVKFIEKSIQQECFDATPHKYCTSCPYYNFPCKKHIQECFIKCKKE